MANATRGTLILAATPIGNSADASDRLKQELAQAEIILAEDTRKFRQLQHRLGVESSALVWSYFEGNELTREAQILEELAADRRILLVTDAGAPAVSDPGYRIVQAALAANVRLVVLPGPSAVVTALLLSGLPTDRFCFEGFLSRKSGAKLQQLQDLAQESRTMIFFEAPHRLVSTLEEMVKAFGSARAGAICREMTKTFEETVRASLGQLLAWARAQEQIRGEISLVVAGQSAQERAQQAPTLAELAQRLVTLPPEQRKPELALLAQRYGIAKRELFDAVVAAKQTKPGAEPLLP